MFPRLMAVIVRETVKKVLIMVGGLILVLFRFCVLPVRESFPVVVDEVHFSDCASSGEDGVLETTWRLPAAGLRGNGRNPDLSVDRNGPAGFVQFFPRPGGRGQASQNPG